MPQTNEENMERSQYVTGWTWKHWDLFLPIMLKNLPGHISKF